VENRAKLLGKLLFGAVNSTPPTSAACRRTFGNGRFFRRANKTHCEDSGIILLPHGAVERADEGERVGFHFLRVAGQDIKPQNYFHKQASTYLKQMHIVEIILGLLVAVAGLALVAHRFNIPYPILLVLGGLLLAVIPGLPVVRLEPELVFLFFLPPLIYPAALFTSWRDFKANLRPITLLAFGLVLITTVGVGWLAHWLTGMPLAAGFVLGAIISPPDAVAATAITERLRVPRRIVIVLEGESLVNDATALVAYRFGIAAVLTGAFSFAEASVQFLLAGGGGILFGLAVAWVVTRVQARLDDPPVQTTLSLLTPFAIYLPADRLGMSGVLAVVAAGIYIGWRAPEIVTARTRLHIAPFWEMVQFLLNGLVFILIGLQLPEVLKHLAVESKTTLLLHAAAICAAVILIRIAWVFPATYLPRCFSRRLRARDPAPNWRPVMVVAWTGMRGVVSLAAAMALPLTLADGSPFPGRDLILFFTFSVILATLVVQGLTLPPLIRWLGVVDDGAHDREERLARRKANEAALARLRELENTVDREALEHHRHEYEDRIRQLTVCDPGDAPHAKRMHTAEHQRVLAELLVIERRTIIQLRNEQIINDTVLRRIQRDLDLAEERLIKPSA
jgi:CPA1 family monovalent cation:H+ antiporter